MALDCEQCSLKVIVWVGTETALVCLWRALLGSLTMLRSETLVPITYGSTSCGSVSLHLQTPKLGVKSCESG